MAGNGKAGFSGDDGPATSAEINAPSAAAVDSAGNLIVAYTGNNRIRRRQPAPATSTASR